MGVGADLGTIEPGKLADLVVVDGNPLANITDLRRTRRVVKDGVVYEVERCCAARSLQPALSGVPGRTTAGARHPAQCALGGSRDTLRAPRLAVSRRDRR